jgi:molybdopterin-containing oxidoreductase family iron-sulfur binding subunit
MKAATFWRTLEEYSNFEEFQKSLHDEFPQGASEKPASLDRREFLSLVSASLAFAGVTSCAPTVPEKIVPYVRQPDNIVPGKPLFFATAFPLGGYGLGVLAESHMGRPTKIEGNPDHPASLGSTDIFAQASILSLYDPDRSKVILNGGQISTWDAFITALTSELEAKRLNNGEGLRILTETVTSPTLVLQIRKIFEQFPAVQWHQYEPVNSDNLRAASRLAFGKYVDARYHFDKADVILSLDADFLSLMPGHVRYARDFTSRRRAQPPWNRNAMNRLYVLESTPSITGAAADHRRPVRASDVYRITSIIADALAGKTSSGDPWIDALARDLRSKRGKSLVIAGPHQRPEVHVLTYAMNAGLGNVGQTIDYIEPVEPNPVEQLESLMKLTRDMQDDAVDLLIVAGGNPVYTAPADLEFAQRFANVRMRIHVGLYEDETSELCHWHVPETHYLESWGDIRSFDGTTTIMQPLINPLYGGKSAYEVLSAVLGQPTRTAYEIVRETWGAEGRDDKVWRKAVHDGVVGAVYDRSPIREQKAGGHRLPLQLKVGHRPPLQLPEESSGAAAESVEVVFRPDPSVYDGRFANNGWLQELPKPLSKIVWDNAALVSPATAQRLSLSPEDVIEIQHHGRAIQAPVWISPGHAQDSITLFLGYGRRRAGTLGSNRGYNANSIRTSSAPWIVQNAEVRKTGERYTLVSTQRHHLMENRHLVRRATAEEYANAPEFVRAEGDPPPLELSLYPEFPPADYAWGMAIDLSTCIGCNACVAACQAENNIPIVGKDEAGRSREMHWLRIDTYYEGDWNQPEILFQPMLCQHCERAPCEPVCPVAATTHSNEGLNEMTYNRCVGTRYCSNNCPYKVRRFNFFDLHAGESPSMALLYNPDVTVRSRGVMEKCTYCVQRINHARIEAKKEDRLIRDGEVVTACQGVCPADAIVFGNIADTGSRVAKLKAEPRNYAVLAELNTRPRTTYLAKITNPNPEMKRNEK